MSLRITPLNSIRDAVPSTVVRAVTPYEKKLTAKTQSAAAHSLTTEKHSVQINIFAAVKSTSNEASTKLVDRGLRVSNISTKAGNTGSAQLRTVGWPGSLTDTATKPRVRAMVAHTWSIGAINKCFSALREGVVVGFGNQGMVELVPGPLL